ncbi:hypothetical protein MKX01_039267, partial [Papaver californicum]
MKEREKEWIVMGYSRWSLVDLNFERTRDFLLLFRRSGRCCRWNGRGCYEILLPLKKDNIKNQCENVILSIANAQTCLSLPVKADP